VSAAQSSILQSEDKLTQCGLQMYQSRFRHTQARTIIQSCFKKVYNITLNTDVKYSFSTAQADLPYVLTDRVLTVLKQVCFDLRIKQPILVTGGEACGKSELLLTLAWLHSKRIHQLNITPETEPTSLIGQLIPNDTRDPDDPTYGMIMSIFLFFSLYVCFLFFIFL
jgi:midasin (ATPase involved in ribosome maturation)